MAQLEAGTRVLVMGANAEAGSGMDELRVVRKSELSPSARAPTSGALRWLTLGGHAVAGGQPAPPGGIRLLPVSPGLGSLALRERFEEFQIIQTRVLHQGQGLTPDRMRVALSRELASELSLAAPEAADENEEISISVCGPAAALPSLVKLISNNAEGRYLDRISELPLVSAPVPPENGEFEAHGIECAVSPPVRVVPDLVDRTHPRVAARSLVGEIGGEIAVEINSQVGARLLVSAPFGLVGGEKEHRLRLVTHVLRSFPGGPPAVGLNDEESLEIARTELRAAGRIWGQCGISFGPWEDLSVEIVDPPIASLLTVGCGEGLPASGGEINFLVDGRTVVMRTSPGQSPRAVASRLAASIRSLGFTVRVFANAALESRALPSFDLDIQDSQGRRPPLGQNSGRKISTDPSLDACIYSVDLSDGLSHFVDEDAAAGTPEERMILRFVGDGDPSTVDLFFIPTFSGLGRIGESFIYSPGASLINALIVDRSGLRAAARSATLAHELGHILLSMPGHPDDYGVDTPTSLMDADAADASVYGPRRLSLSDCRRALLQSGQGTSHPLLFPVEK